ncbi:6,7-dimethyl-8-ribityllumazine synthase [Desulfotalea psychrophila]|uniref:6,7-dimethyl-8-ribityllumazine synthase n=1 Tax=Desulfotalea psychrophila (strain LSv54 / DSM 12343) TaxID=177439 RepID=RISB_DESPS|nr:6,7-dimethyl-8-ribityllumazine synthase [Desulfotalea psychrophila]Q6AP94.1 RecName: Full=6,7-dimethyl-8-ribityllumazine synthase; Short=DMRL synthase; Short=LS; Short=Lumazine synthase [Desulfotalea psychrophila LSv54]CAG35830.1 probable riboflavin synthase, beta chain [Desulfotalea psychrophila LSv54]
MPNFIEGNLKADGKKFAIIVARFNSFISDKLLDGALDSLVRSGATDSDIDVVRVPGAYEIPLIAKKLAASLKYDAVICLGAVIRGATPHFDVVVNEVSKGSAQVSLETGVPVLFGVLTTETIEQAIERSGTKAGNKGSDVAIAAIEMANLVDALQ